MVSRSKIISFVGQQVRVINPCCIASVVLDVNVFCPGIGFLAMAMAPNCLPLSLTDHLGVILSLQGAFLAKLLLVQLLYTNSYICTLLQMLIASQLAASYSAN